MKGDIIITLGEGGIAIGASMTSGKEINNPFISLEPMRNNIPIGATPKDEDFADDFPRVIIDILNKESLDILAGAVDACRKRFEQLSTLSEGGE